MRGLEPEVAQLRGQLDNGPDCAYRIVGTAHDDRKVQRAKQVGKVEVGCWMLTTPRAR